MFLKREVIDVLNNIIHKIMFVLGLFDYKICNCYNEISEKELLNIINSQGD